MDELRFERIDEDNGRRAFRVTLTDPAIVANRATTAVEEAGRTGCDIVLFPELCLTPDGQQRLRAATAAAARSWGRPWLVVAGSSHTPAADGFHNRALVIDADGRECLTHNKLFAYQISTREQSRYAIGDALKSEPRDEDIIVVPRRLQLLECVLGRAAVLICEDLSNVLGTFAPILDRFEIDWLLVPVMDGVQTDARWPANYAMTVANECGTNVIVATCGALVSAHRADLRQNGQVDPGHACGLLVQRGAWEANAVPLAAVDEGDNLVISFISGIRGRA
jgi:predicted amidohydrolase